MISIFPSKNELISLGKIEIPLKKIRLPNYTQRDLLVTSRTGNEPISAWGNPAS
jgi:hypothetical protein